jgi:hypothetical protein
VARDVHRHVVMRKPSWWNDKHEGTWDRVKSAMKRDWEQTKHDFGSKKAPDLDQDVGDTVKQMAGKEPMPPGALPNPSDMDKAWDDIEPAFRYGVGARAYYNEDWAKTESRMSNEWSSLDDDRDWDDVKGQVRRAYEYGERKK